MPAPFYGAFLYVRRSPLCRLRCAPTARSVCASHLTCIFSQVDVVRELLRPIEGEPQPNADQAYVQGLTPLHFASSIGNLDLVSLLVSAGASPSRADDDGLSAARYAGANAAVLAQLHVDPATLAQVSSSAKSISTLQPPPTAHLLRPLLRPPVDESDPMAGKTEKKPAPPPTPNPESMQLLEDLLVALDLSKYAARFRTEGIDVRDLCLCPWIAVALCR